MDGTPRVSVIIPARDAGETIVAAVAAAWAQDFEGGHEVIVIDDGSTDGTAALAEAAGARVLSNGYPRGPAEARNRGAAAAAGELFAFTDADCRPAPGWLAAGVGTLARAEIVQGRVEPDANAVVGPFDHFIAVRSESGLFESANLFVTRAWFERVGGFRAFIDPAIGHFGEDALFGWSVVRAGGRKAFASDALVYHAVIRRGGTDWLRERLRLAMFPALIAQVPELRTRLVGGMFLSRRSACVDLALTGLTASVMGRRAWPLLAALPYARGWLREAPPRLAAVLVAGDCLGALALAAGSARARTPVL